MSGEKFDMDKAKERAKDAMEKILDAADNYYDQVTDRLVDRAQKVEEKLNK